MVSSIGVALLAVVPKASARPLVISAGLQSSGSTWLFNLIAAILRRKTPGAVIHTVYSDTFAGDILAADAAPDTTIVKTHRLPAAVRTLAKLTAAPVLLTVRDPKDAVASLRTRFAMDFEQAFKEVRQSANALAPLALEPAILTLRYEDGFTKRRETIDLVAAHLGVKLRRKDRDKIWRALTPKAVRARIDELAAAGAFSDAPFALTFDPRTHWHPGHVGEGQVGRWRQVLSTGEAARIDKATGAFRAAFGYGQGGGNEVGSAAEIETA